MSVGKLCKNCPRYHKGRSWCDRKGVFRSPWDDWCAERDAEYEEWKLGGCQ